MEDEDDVTAEMIEVGAKILSDVFDTPQETARSFAAEIYMAMRFVQRAK